MFKGKKVLLRSFTALTVLVLSLMVAGCKDASEEDLWKDIKNLSELYGKWKGSSTTERDFESGVKEKVTVEMDIEIKQDEEEKARITGTQKYTQKYTGTGVAAYWEDAKVWLGSEGWTLNNADYSATITRPLNVSITFKDVKNSMLISSDGKKLRLRSEGEDIILTKY